MDSHSREWLAGQAAHGEVWAGLRVKIAIHALPNAHLASIDVAVDLFHHVTKQVTDLLRVVGHDVLAGFLLDVST
eukprot:8331145-Lingulodinium_polyedra.AAC.1